MSGRAGGKDGRMAEAAAACSSSAACSLAGLREPSMQCCPAADGTYLPCCPLRCFFDGIRCMPLGRADILADRGCAERLRPDGAAHWDLSEGAGDLLCRAGGPSADASSA